MNNRHDHYFNDTCPELPILRQHWVKLRLLILAALLLGVGFCQAKPITLGSITPDSGPAGTVVTIFGTGFSQPWTGFAVSFNGKPADAYSIISDAQLNAIVPASATTGTITVQGYLLNSQPGAVTKSVFTVTVPPPPAPIISSFNPTSGKVGATVTIQGSGFAGVTSVRFNGIAAAFSSVNNSDTTLTAYVPANAATGPLKVITPSGTAVSADNFTIIVQLPTPGITSFSPTSGLPGSKTTLTGTNFTGTGSVLLGSIPATFQFLDDQHVSVIVPQTAVTAPFSVTTPGGTAITTISFQVLIPVVPPTITQLSPTQGLPGAQVQITGTGFTGVTGVNFNGTPANFTVGSATSITAFVPANASSGLVTVTATAGTATSPTPFTVQALPPPPTITSVSPTSGGPGTAVSLNGTHFTGATLVTFNGAPAAFTVVSDGQISTTVPASGTTGPLAVITPAGTATSPSAFTVITTPVGPVISSFYPASGAASTPVSLFGSGFTGVTGVTFNGVYASFNVISPNQITTTVPIGAFTGPIAVFAANGTGYSPASFSIPVAAGPPVITSIAPDSGVEGDSVAIYGQNLLGAILVFFNGVQAAFNVNSSAEITALVPHDATTGPITINFANAAATSPTPFVITGVLPVPIITALMPTNGAPGDTIVLTGTNFNSVTLVAFNNSSGGQSLASYTIDSDNQIHAVVPGDAVTGPVDAFAGNYFGSSPAPFLIDTTPVITAFEPAFGYPGQTLTIHGGNLALATFVAIGGQGVDFTTPSDSQLVVTIPDGIFSGFVSVTSPQGTAYSDTEFHVIPRPLPPPGTSAPGTFTVSAPDNRINFSFPIEANRSYSVQSANNLASGNWRTIRYIPPQTVPGTVNVSDFFQSNGRKFYRVATDLPGFLLDNWDFELGLSQWSASGDAFTNQPVCGECVPATAILPVPLGGDYWHVPYPVGVHNYCWISTGIEHQDGAIPAAEYLDDSLNARTGTLTSREFRVTNPFLTFLVGGGNDVFNLRVELQIKVPDAAQRASLGIWGMQDDFAIVNVATGLGVEVMSRTVWDVSAYAGYLARIRIVDNSPTKHINVDDFRFPTIDPTASLQWTSVKGYGFPVDANSPVWGVLDTHTHPMVHLAYGGKFIAGEPDGPISTALASCEDHHGTLGTGIRVDGGSELVGTPFMALSEDSMPGSGQAGLFLGAVLTGVAAPLALNPFLLGVIGIVDIILPFYGLGNPLGHPTGGYQYGFDGWPSFASKTHEQMYVDWIRRAYDGGLRLMVAHAVNNELIGKSFGGTAPFDDKASAESQIAAMRLMVANHADFMAIARTPDEARGIIRSNKLAIILGIEEDALGGFINENTCTDLEVSNYLAHIYYDLDVRHVFPIHVSDNAFGGCGLYEDQWGLNSYTLRGVPVEVSASPDPLIQFRMGESPPLNIGILSQALYGYNPPDYNHQFTNVVPGTMTPPGHVNARHLTARGTNAIQQMMHLGMIIDIDHSGYYTRGDILTLAESQHYPLIDGHCGFNELALRRDETSAPGKLSHEADPVPDYVERMRALGGIVSCITVAKDVKPWGTEVPADCPGSAKSFAQNYLYALDHMDGHNVALGTDFQLVIGSGPRFGLNAAFGLSNRENAQHDDLRKPLYGAMVNAQNNGVVYDRPITDYRAYRFHVLHDADYWDGDQRDGWEALAMAAAGVDPDSAWQPDEFHPFFARDAFTRARISTLAAGFSGRVLPFTFGVNANYYSQGAFDLMNGGLGSDDYFMRLKVVVDRWKAMQAGDNTPLQRYSLPAVQIDDNHLISRDFDINLDGFAHYGLLPDFLQDLKNCGVSLPRMAPLFGSAEDYIKMWENCQANRP